jgi:hypothetical protein
MRNAICTSFILAFSLTGYAQETDWRLYQPRQEGDIRMQQRNVLFSNTVSDTNSGKIYLQVDKRIVKMDSLRKAFPSAMEGYRVQIFFGGRNEAQKMRGEFLRSYPQSSAYISYLAPNFRLRVGDFRSKIEGEKFKNEVLSDFPGSYIVKDDISMPALHESVVKEK